MCIHYKKVIQDSKTWLHFISDNEDFIFIGRRAKKQAQKTSSKIPDLRDHELVQKFFLQEVQFITTSIKLHIYIFIDVNFLQYKTYLI